MADIAVENKDTPIVEKEVEDVDVPKVVDEDEKVAVENGKGEEEATPEVVAAPENGTTEAEPEVTSTPAEGTDAVADDAAAKNGDYTEAAPEAVKRKIPADSDATEAANTEDVESPTPEKKSKLEEAPATENGGAETEVAA